MLAEPRARDACCLWQGAAGAGAGARVARGAVACCRCAHARRASPLTCLAVCFLVLTYNLLGGFLFLALEGAPEEPVAATGSAAAGAVAASKPNLSQAGVGAGEGGSGVGGELRARTVERLWAITEDLNILYKENWTALAAQELLQLERALRVAAAGTAPGDRPPHPPHRPRARWTFATSFLYALTLITTIGQGEVAPRSAAGRLVAVAYACVGIPLVMLYLSTLGGALARAFRTLYGRCSTLRAPPAPLAPPDAAAERRTPFQAALNLSSLRGGGGGASWPPRECGAHARVPAPLGAALVAGYVALGTLVFRATEKWSFVDGCYFSFSSLATIGFGDLRPGLHASTVSAKAEDVAVGVCCVYILVGIVVVAMCFNLIQEDISSALRTFSTLYAGSKARAVHSAERACDEKAALLAARMPAAAAS